MNSKEITKKPPRTTIEVQFETEDDVVEFKEYCLKRAMSFGGFARIAIEEKMGRDRAEGVFK